MTLQTKSEGEVKKSAVNSERSQTYIILNQLYLHICV